MLTGLLGHRVAYSASPAMLRAAFAAAGLDWSYDLIDVAPADLPGAVEGLRGEGWAGANVTIPHKVSIATLLDEIDSVAREVGAVNFIRRDGRLLVGGNTDVDGLRMALAEVGIADPGGLDAVVLGTGGSARACRHVLAGARLAFVARRPNAAWLADTGSVVFDWADAGWRRRARTADLLVNATPIGRTGDSPCGPDDLPLAGAVIDLVYATPTTPLVATCRAGGRPAADGWTVLLGQGAAAFARWTGGEAPLAAMRAALAA